jgi:hypothetical protein
VRLSPVALQGPCKASSISSMRVERPSFGHGSHTGEKSRQVLRQISMDARRHRTGFGLVGLDAAGLPRGLVRVGDCHLCRTLIR